MPDDYPGTDPMKEAAERGHVDGSDPGVVENPLDQVEAANEPYRRGTSDEPTDPGSDAAPAGDA